MPALLRRIAIFCLPVLSGCGGAVKYASDFVQGGDRRNGVIYYVGGAGPVGNVGFLSVPRGMADAGFAGYVEVFPWQGIGAAADQINLSRNRGKALELADKIRQESRRNPDAPIHLIALSAGTGIATFALEYLPEDVRVRNVVFLGCSLSSRYDLTRALKRINGRLITFYSPDDLILTRVVPYTGTVDRGDASEGVAGLVGFRLPETSASDTREQYRKVLNIGYQPRFADAGYRGGHMDATTREFIAWHVAPLVLDRDSELLDVATSPVEEPRGVSEARRPAARRPREASAASPRRRRR